MEPLALACTKMQSENSIDWGFQFPLINKLIKCIESVEGLKHCEPLKTSLLISMSKRFPEYKCIYNLVATALHPTFKKTYITDNIINVDIEEIVTKIVRELDLIDLEQQQTPFQVSTPSVSPVDDNMSYFFSDQPSCQTTAVNNRLLLEQYFAENDKSLELLLQPKYEKIKKVFIKYNTRLLSSASSERLFSLAKHIMTYARTSLLDENFEMLTILNVSRKNSRGD